MQVGAQSMQVIVGGGGISGLSLALSPLGYGINLQTSAVREILLAANSECIGPQALPDRRFHGGDRPPHHRAIV